MAKKHDIIWLESVDSTNEECRRHISDIDNLSVVSALSQTSGRGQRGNTWCSAPGENLTFSIVLKFPAGRVGAGVAGGLEPIQAYDQFVLSEIIALSVVDLLAGYDIQAMIKWPNDIYVGDRKICGILIENSVRGEWLSHSIVGIGLNVNQRNFDVNLPNPTSMVICRNYQEARSDCPANEALGDFGLQPLLEEFMEIFKAYLDRFCHIRGGYARLRQMYLSHLWRKDEPAQYIDKKSSREFTGTIRGLSDMGNLLIKTEDGILQEFSFNEISYLLPRP